MTVSRSVRAEARKLAGPTSTRVAVVLGSVLVAGLAWLNGTTAARALVAGRDDLVDTSLTNLGFEAATVSSVVAIVLGVTAVGGEYVLNSPDCGGGRQITTTLLAMPRRGAVFVAKSLVVTVTSLVVGVLATAVGIGVGYLAYGAVLADAGVPMPPVAPDLAWRIVGVGVYWAAMGLVALAFATVTRSSLVPLALLIGNMSVVSLSVLLTWVHDGFWHMPDLAGSAMFLRGEDVAALPSPEVGAAIMIGAALGLLAVAGISFVVRDA